MPKLRDECSPTDLRAIRELQKWVQGGKATAGEVKAAADTVVNWCEFILEADVVKRAR